MLVDRTRLESVYVAQSAISVHISGWSPVLQKPIPSIKQVYNVAMESQNYGVSHRLLHANHTSGLLFFSYCCVLMDARLQHVAAATAPLSHLSSTR